MIELNGILDRDNVVIDVLVDVVDHAGQRRALAAPGGPGHQEEATRPHTELGDDFRCPQLLERKFVDGDLPQHHGHVAPLTKDRYTEARLISERKAKIATASFLKFLLAAIGRDALHQRHAIVRIELFCFQPSHATVQTKHRRLPHGQMDVACTLLNTSC